MKLSSGFIRFLVPFLLFLAAFHFLLSALNPSFYGDDSPETITAAATLGVPHPPGYPFLTLLGHIATLFSLGGIPFRVNLLSAFLAAIVCVLLFLFLVKALRVNPRFAVPIALMWVTGASLYPAALSAKGEVYELNALFLLGLFWSLREGKTWLAAFLAGIFFTHHWMTLVVSAPGLVAMAYLEREKRSVKEGGLFPMAACFTLGSSLWLALPILSTRGPLLNWGSPWNLKNFLFVLARREYQGAEANGSLSDWFSQAQYAFTGQWVEFAGLSLAALVFALPLLKKKVPLAIGLITGWACLLLTVSLYLHLSVDRFYLISSYILPTHLMVLIFLGWGIGQFQDQLEPALKKRFLAGVAVLLALWALGLGTFRTLKDRQTNYSYVYDFTLNSFKCLPENSLFFCRGDGLVFPSWYFQWVERFRPDLAVVGVDGLPMDWIRRDLNFQHPKLSVPFSRQPMGNESISNLMSWLILKNNSIPQFLSYNQIDSKTQPVQNLLPYGLVYQCFINQTLPPLDELKARYLWDALRMRHLSDSSIPIDMRTRQWILEDYAVDRNGLGVYFENRADDATARLSKPPNPQDQLQILQDYLKSFQQYAWCQNFNPTDPIYAFNVGNALVHLGRNSEALDYYAKALLLDPKYKDAYFNAAVAALNLGQGQKAGEMFQKVLDLDPNHAEAKRGLEFVKQQGWFHAQ